MVRTRTEVEQEIEATRSALLAADEAVNDPTEDPEAWALGGVLPRPAGHPERPNARCSLTSHTPRLPAASDGHAAPKPF